MKASGINATGWARSCVLAVSACVLAACTGGGAKPKPVELSPNAALIGVRQAWSLKIGAVNFPLDVKVNGERITLASSDGTLVGLESTGGREIWRAKVSEPLAAGVGSDGKTAAVVTRSNMLIALRDGKELWRQRIPAQVYTAPLVAGERVFVLAADRSVSAFDGATGRKLWAQQRPGDALVLREAGVIRAVGDTLIVGLSGRMVGLNPLSGSVRWEVPIATARGANDVERLIDLVGSVSREGTVVCARAFQVAVGCVDTAKGTLVWSTPSNGVVGVHGNERSVFGVEADGKILAWSRVNGDRQWVSERLKYRAMTAPLAVGRSVAVGDDIGLIHLLSVEDGSPLNRLTTDGSAIAATPVLAGDTLVAVTRNGGVFGFRPE
ncbi:MAG: outer membrane protein assembly factor BamB [Comamonadaceae bacterium]|uniref:outer membrane protein assembly factor BamB n=1 Tax=Candidatus Skiveiella danica TaxID=3386177 RepID=UPI001DC6421C|nr:outer membrane protein assembly factor BamB [Comamonadaceae bacterium]MBK7119496.1 outer membrane protein assembly factor BamB [Comamonadaceae bacterium]MBK9199269.1 outer membrane protein assembly factor BamB [Betaproteobacteria bacterium]